MLRKNIKLALAALALSSLAPFSAQAGGLPEVCGDIGPDVVNLLNRYAATDAANFCVRAMTLAETRCFRQRGEVIQQANLISRRWNLAPVVPGCQPPVLLAAAPPPVYVPPPVLAAGAREAVSHASLFAGSWWLLGLLPLGGLAFIGGGGHHDTTTTVTTATNLTDEFYANYALNVIHANVAYDRKFTGLGVKVAVLDTGVDTSHNEFGGRIASAFDFTTNTSGQGTVTNPHGTEVAGIIAANRNFHGMEGVAYDSQLIVERVFDANNAPLNDGTQILTFAPAIQYAVNNGASIINGSYGPDKNWHDNASFLGYQYMQPHDLQDGAAYVAAAQAGKILVFPAGDYYGLYPTVAANPTGPGFLPFITPSHDAITGVQNGAYRNQDGSTVTSDFSAMLPNTIVVVSTNAGGNTISSFSNRCGVAAAWCMAAPGENIFTTGLNDTYTTVTGTSFAAPQVSGAAAILKQEFPSLSAAQIVQILLTTATDLGAPGVDAIYGHGLLNLAKATAPIGSTSLALTNNVNGASASLQGSSLTFGTAFGISASQMLNSQNVAFLDSYQRSYSMPLSTLVHVGAAFDNGNALFNYGIDQDRTKLSINDHMTLAFSNDSSSVDPRLTTDKPVAPGDSNFDMKSFVVTDEMSKDTTASVHYKDADALSLGFSEADRGRMERSIVKSNLQNPYAAFAAANGYASVIETEALGGKVRVAGFFGREEGISGSGAEGRSFGSQIETTYNLGSGSKASFLAGAVFEDGSVLGSVGAGAFSFGQGTMTTYTGVGGSYALDNKTTLHGTAYAGYTKPSLSNDSLITGMSNLITTSFNLGIDRAGVATKNDRLSLGIAQPVRVENGNMQFSVPYARDDNSSTMYTANLTQDFGKQGREIDLELNYTLPVEANSEFSLGALYRHDAGHEAGNNDMLALVRYINKF